MTLRFSTSDNFSNSRDNLSRTASQFADSRQIQKNILSADSYSLRWTVAPSLTAFLKTTYNKVAGQLLSRFTISHAQTAAQKICRQILHSVRLAHLRPCFNECNFYWAQKSKPSAIKNSRQKFK